MELRALNLNLLLAFDALYEERSVTRAARRMGVTQSAMSSSLAQLRGQFDDTLFRRTSHGIEPTSRADAIAGEIRAGLASFQRALAPAAFDPATSTRTFVIQTSDFIELVLLPALLRRLAREAPGVRIELAPWGLHEVPPSLARGEADLAIGFFDEMPRAYRNETLFEDRFTCIVRKDHPRVRTRLTLATWLELPHVLVSQKPGSPGAVDLALARIGKQRTVGARVSHFLLAPVMVARTDMVAAVSETIADIFAVPLGLRRLPPPIPLARGRVAQVWHEQRETDAGHRWLRGLIAETGARL